MRIVAVQGHFEAYTDSGVFICSGDSISEIMHELAEGGEEDDIG